MSVKKTKIKFRLKKKSVFLGLIKKFRTHEHLVTYVPTNPTNVIALSFKPFKKVYIPLLNIFYIFNGLRFVYVNTLGGNLLTTKYYLSYYAKLSKLSVTDMGIGRTVPNNFNTFLLNHILIFSKPKKQLFVTFFKKQPIFVFTGGLMRIVMNEKRKSSKKLYKVAISLIKLSIILLSKKNFLNSCYLKLINIGSIRTKLLNMLSKSSIHKNIHYIILYFSLNYSAQKFNTRRSIKKYIKKRFKLY